MRAWLAHPAGLFDTVEEISADGPRLAELVAPRSFELSALFSAGARGAFHGVLAGNYLGGFTDDAVGVIGTPITLPIAGIIDTDSERVTRVQLCGDRLGLQRRLMTDA